MRQASDHDVLEVAPRGRSASAMAAPQHRSVTMMLGLSRDLSVHRPPVQARQTAPARWGAP